MIMSPLPIDSDVVVKAPSSLKMSSPSLAQVAMELHSNIPMLPSTKILYIVPIDVPTPTPRKVSKPLFVEVLIPPFCLGTSSPHS